MNILGPGGIKSGQKKYTNKDSGENNRQGASLHSFFTETLLLENVDAFCLLLPYKPCLCTTINIILVQFFIQCVIDSSTLGSSDLPEIHETVIGIVNHDSAQVVCILTVKCISVVNHYLRFMWFVTRSNYIRASTTCGLV